jgi:glycosyltransferase involved in cell wall biosynthesis
MRISVVTKIPSPYQVELFDAVSREPGIDLEVAYVRARDADRAWSDPRLDHRAWFLDSDASQISRCIAQSDLAVFGWYRDPRVMRLLASRARAKLPWAFWGERPGFRYKGLIGTTYRRWRLRALWRDERVPIWGIGHWANEGYCREFGNARSYFHVPYVSNLKPFFEISKPPRRVETILFSGSLIARKGIDTLCEAFTGLDRGLGVRLRVLGGGPLESKLRQKYAGDPRIEFLGFRDWQALADAYRGSQLLCAPSLYDGWGLIVAEAMAAGMPVIGSSQMGSAREMIDQDRTGWLVTPGEVETLRRSLANAIALSGERLGAMQEACRLRAREYDVQAGVRRFLHAASETLREWQAAGRSLVHQPAP